SCSTPASSSSTPSPAPSRPVFRTRRGSPSRSRRRCRACGARRAACVRARGVLQGAGWRAARRPLRVPVVGGKPRGFGATAQVEGNLSPGARVLLVDDVTTDGRTKAALCGVLRAVGARVDHVFVLFYYDVFPEARTLL